MKYPSFVGASSRSQSVVADGSRTVNWYEEQTNSAEYPTVFYPTPGMIPFFVSNDLGTRGLFAMNNRLHAVTAGNVREVFATGTATIRGAVAQNGYPAQLAANIVSQLLISSGANAYLLDLGTNVFTQVLTGDATMVGFIDNYFVAFNIATNRYRISNLNNGLVWDSTQFLARSIAPDPWQAMVVDGNRQIWLIGEQSGEVHYNAGTFPFPFAPIPGAVFGFGTMAPFSAKVVGDSVMWLSQTVDGAGIVVSARGYTPQRVSTNAIETLIAGYARTAVITDADAFAYQDQGHLFYVLNFPSVPATLVYDKTTNRWAERGIWNPPQNRYEVWGPRVHAYAFGQHLVGDRTTATIAAMDVTYGSELSGAAIRRLRIPPPLTLATGKGRMFITRLEVLLEPGLGLIAGQGVNPIVMLRQSKDAKTWGNQRTASAGRMGEYETRCFFTRLGSSTGLWVPEITVTDPNMWRLLGLEVEGSGFAVQQSRAA